MSSYTREQLEDWVKSISVEGKVLDVGGSQSPVKNRLGNKGEVSEFTILDLEQPHECKQEPDLTSDLNELIMFTRKGSHSQDVGIEEMEKYDVAFCLEVSEYWYDPRMVLYNIANFLKQDGILYISFHFFYPVHNPPTEDCLRYTPLGAKKLLEKAGFEILEETPRVAEQPDLLRAFYSQERMRPSKIWAKHNQVGSLIKARKE